MERIITVKEARMTVISRHISVKMRKITVKIGKMTVTARLSQLLLCTKYKTLWNN